MIGNLGGRKYKEPETERQMLARWHRTGRDPYGQFTGTPNRKRMMPPSEGFKK